MGSTYTLVLYIYLVVVNYRAWRWEVSFLMTLFFHGYLFFYKFHCAFTLIFVYKIHS